MDKPKKDKGESATSTTSTSRRDSNTNVTRNEVFSWSAPETNSRHKSSDWYFILWTLAIAGAIISMMLDNVLFGLLILISTFTISIYAARKPKNIPFTVSRRGITADSMLLPFSTLSHFAIAENQEPTYLLLQSNKVLAPLNSFPISPEVDVVALREFLLLFLEEGEIDVPAYQRLMDRIGF